MAVDWPKRWNFQTQFEDINLVELSCGKENNAILPTSCCVCNAIMHRIEEELNATLNDHPVDTVFRLSEEKHTVPYSHSEGRIMEVLDTVCQSVTVTIPDEIHTGNANADKLIHTACERFVQEYEDETIRIFYDDRTPGQDRMCINTLSVCPGALSHDDL